jgi:predicted adenine nucleotide alpha hydrolase (AANH) superfamily ATPase
MQKRNYQKELDQIIEKNIAAGIRPKLLVHSCCAPCSSYVMEYLGRYFDLTMFFYNPNMDSPEEYRKRAEELQRLIGELNRTEVLREHPVRAVIADYDPAAFEQIAEGHEQDPERGTRCRRCYELRLRRTAEYMLEHNRDCPAESYDFFATTLTLSPLKDAEALNLIAEQIAEQLELGYLVSDFKKREGYKRSIELSREYHLYRQNYCGCRFSRAAAEYQNRRDTKPAG